MGRAIVAIRDNHIAAEAMGVNSALYKSLTFGVSAAYTGVAGALSALAIAYVAPDSFNVFLSITLLIGIVIGGLGSISGATSSGRCFIQFVPNWAQDISKAAPWAIFGVFLIGFMYVDAVRASPGPRLLWIRAARPRVSGQGGEAVSPQVPSPSGSNQHQGGQHDRTEARGTHARRRPAGRGGWRRPSAPRPWSA